jgi:addiction module RelE/StbE family toxin
VKLIWTDRATQDIEDIWIYIAADSKASATRTITKIRQAARRLIKHPETGRPGRTAGTRELVVSGTPYILPYWVRGTTLKILAVVHGRQEYPKQPSSH